jgi:hypothetical protein
MKRGLRKYSQDKEFCFDIHIGWMWVYPNYNAALHPDIRIFSKELKQLITKNKNGGWLGDLSSGLIYWNDIRNISPYKKHEWIVDKINIENTINEVIDCIKNYVLPVFNIFNNKEGVIEYLKAEGTKFNNFSERELMPLSFLLNCSNKENAEIFFNDYINECKDKENIIKIYENYNKCGYLEEHLRYDDEYIRLAYNNELKIKKSTKCNGFIGNKKRRKLFTLCAVSMA